MIELKSELMGTVCAITASAGHVVSAGETVLLIESMKMEIPVMAPVACSIIEITVAPGTQIVEGQTVALLEPA